MLYVFKASGGRTSPPKFTFLHAFCDRSHDTAEVSNESLIKVCKTMETSNFSECSRNRPIKNCFDLIRVHFNSLCRHKISQENNRITHKCALFEIKIESLSAKELANYIQMLKMLCVVPAVD
eukprot:TRINITY_DN12973_c0_g2_i7.p2 TRINITY_DN12973_c0_g2~~TRINITY_DN12973_c0_g2_i7.p2  ORF type:complete len:122 (+),score=15.76 TRINITY_DN12973_c0_g2_i7:109-474(+)